MNGCEFSPRLGVPSVHIDNAKAAGEVMDHLYRLGHRRIAVITGPLVSPLSRDRLRGATRARGPRRARPHRHAGRFLDLIGCSGCRAAPAASDPPTAVFCFNDEMAIGVIDTAKRLRKSRAERSVGGGIRRYPVRALHGPAAHDDRTAHEGNRGGNRAAPARDPAWQRDFTRVGDAPAHVDGPGQHGRESATALTGRSFRPRPFVCAGTPLALTRIASLATHSGARHHPIPSTGGALGLPTRLFRCMSFSAPKGRAFRVLTNQLFKGRRRREAKRMPGPPSF